MFEKIIVSESLLPVREKACEGDIEAMFELANHVIEGNETKPCGDTAFQIISTMFNHKDFLNNPPRIWNTFILCTWALKLQKKVGKISYSKYIEDSCFYLARMIDGMTSQPREIWDIDKLQNCLQWIQDNEDKIESENHPQSS